MTTTRNRAADGLLADLDTFIRTAKNDGSLPTGDAEEPPADDPETLKEQILTEVKTALDWDGTGGDPNESVAALEDALADMFDADVEIVWDGQAQMTMRVEGEEPVALTPDYLGELLEELARQGGGPASEGDEPDAEVAAERGRTGWRRAGRFESKVNRDPGGEAGGRFIKKGTSAAGAVAGAAAKTAKAGSTAGAGGSGGGKGGGGPQPSKLAARANGRAGPRATSKAVGQAFSAGTGNRVRVSGNKDGSFNVGAKKKKMSGKAVAAIMIAGWLAFGVAGGFLATTLGLPLGFGIAAGAVATIALLKVLR